MTAATVSLGGCSYAKTNSHGQAQAEEVQEKEAQGHQAGATFQGGAGHRSGSEVGARYDGPKPRGPYELGGVVSSATFPPEWSLAERRKAASLEPVLQIKLVEHHHRLRARGLTGLQVNSGRRTPAEQQKLTDRTKDALTAADSAAALDRAGLSGFSAPASKSLHVFGLAYDGEPVPKTEATWAVYGEEAEALGLKWGGRWTRTLPSGRVVSDRPHVQWPGSGEQVRNLAAAGVFGLLALATATMARQEIARRVEGVT